MSEPSVQSIEQVLKMLTEIASDQSIKAREQLLETYMKQDQFLTLLKYSIFIDHEAIQPLVKQQVANMLDRIAVMRMQIEPTPANLQTVFKLHFDVLLNWKLPHNIKKYFFSSIDESLDVWQYELDEFWETAIETSLELLEMAAKEEPGCSKNVGKTIKTTFMPEPVEITLSEPYNKADVLTTIFFFMGIFFDKFILRSEDYKRRRVEMLKRMHRLVFNEVFILSHTDFVHKLLNFQYDFITVLPEEKKLRQVAVEFCTWDELMQDMFTILRLKAVPFKDHPNSFNIFLLSENWENNALIDLRTQALDSTLLLISVINGIVIMSDGLTEVPEQNLSAISLDHSCSSVYYSLMWLAQQGRRPTENELLLELSMLSNLSSYVAIFDLEMRQCHQILSSLALPLINYEVEKNTKTYQDDPAELDKLIINCIDNEKENDHLPAACSLFDMVLQASDPLVSFVRGYLINTIAGRCGKDEAALPLQSEEARNMPVLSVETCFLLLSVMDYKEKSSVEWKALQSILTQEAFRSFTPNQKIYFYSFLCVSYEQLYDASNPGDFVFTYPFEQECPANVQYFALSLYAELDNFYCDIFARKFFENFHKLRKMELFYTVLMKLMKYLNRLNEHSVCRMVDDCVAEAKRLIKACVKRMGNNKATSNDKTFRAIQELSYCRTFARNHEYVRGKPDLIASLVNAFSTAKYMLLIHSDDLPVLIGAELLQCVDRFPDGFVNLIPTVINGFQVSEYNGQPYYQFFGNCLELMGKNTFDETIGSLVSSFYEIFVEGYAYFITFPDEIQENQCLNLANIQALILNLLILFADKLPADSMAEVEKITLEAMEGPYKDDHVIVLRGYNILLLCRVMGSQEYPLQQIHSLLKHSNQFNCKSDAILLIYLLNQIRSQIPVQDHYMLISIVLRLLKAADAFKRTRQVRLKAKITSSNGIFQCLTYPIEMSMTEIEQANLFLTEYSNQYHQLLQHIVEEMKRHPGEKELLVFLEKAQQAAKNKGLVNMGLYDSQEEDEGSQCSEGPKAQPLDDAQRKRRIVKIVGDRDQNGNPQVLYTHMARKRAMKTPPKTQEEVDMARVLKRRKGNESLERVTKRELMMEKRERRATRI